MTTYFYEHIISPDDLYKELEVLDLTDSERNHIVMIVQSTMHHVIMDVILEKLHDDHKHIFLLHIAEDNHEKVWELLREHLHEPEGLILSAIETLKIELLQDIQEAREKPL
jgi:hypothetical protein